MYYQIRTYLPFRLPIRLMNGRRRFSLLVYPGKRLNGFMGKLRDFLSEHWNDIVTVGLVTLTFFLAGKLINYLVF